VQKGLGKSRAGSGKAVSLIKVAQEAGTKAGKTAALDQINRGENIRKQVNDLAQDAWEHDGIPSLERDASEKEWDSIHKSATVNAYSKAFTQALMKRIKR